MKKNVYSFKEVNGKNLELFGVKGSNMAEMHKLSLPVPNGFLISTEACIKFFEEKKVISKDLIAQINKYLLQLEKSTGKTFGGADNPLLIAVRSGAKVSMPGILDTILNVGLNDISVVALARMTKNDSFAFRSYCKYIQTFAEIIYKHNKDDYQSVIQEEVAKNNATSFEELSLDTYKNIIKKFKNIFKEKQKEEFPQQPKTQLLKAIEGVFCSWENERAETYRRIHDIPYSIGTAVTVQAMVFGNLGNDSMTGFAFSRNPENGSKTCYGKIFVNAQGTEIVDLNDVAQPLEVLNKRDPQVHAQLCAILHNLEKHYKNMQEVEFTIERGQLFVLQTKNARCSAKASLKIAVDFVEEGLLDKKNSLLMIDANKLKTENLSFADDKEACENLKKVVEWANENRTLEIRAVVDSKEDTKLATSFESAENLHLAVSQAEKKIFDDMIKSKTSDKRDLYLNKFSTIYKDKLENFKGNSITICLFDMKKCSDEFEKDDVSQLSLAGIFVAFPEIVKMQVLSILTSLSQLKNKKNDLLIEIVVPDVCDCAEFKFIKEIVASVADSFIKEKKLNFTIKIGSMIQTPRACVSADKIAKFADFFLFETNSLTQLTYGLGNCEETLKAYFDNKIFKHNPFKTIDNNGVGKLIRIATELGKSTRADIKLGLTGECANDSDSIEFAHRIGINYVLCKPSNLAIATIAAAQSEIRYSRKKTSFLSKIKRNIKK